VLRYVELDPCGLTECATWPVIPGPVILSMGWANPMA